MLKQGGGAGGALAAPAMGNEGKGAKGSIKAKAGDDDWTDSVTPSRKRKAEEEFEEVAQHVDRDGSDSDVSVEVRAIMSVSDRVGFVSPSLPLWRWTGSRHGPWQESFYLFKGANGPCRMTGC